MNRDRDKRRIGPKVVAVAAVAACLVAPAATGVAILSANADTASVAAQDTKKVTVTSLKASKIDGSPLPAKVTAGVFRLSIGFTVENMQDINPGETISIPISDSGHYTPATCWWSYDKEIKDGNGTVLFNVTNFHGKTFDLKATEAFRKGGNGLSPFYGSSNFTFNALTNLTIYDLKSREQLAMTSTTMAVGEKSITFNNDPVTVSPGDYNAISVVQNGTNANTSYVYMGSAYSGSIKRAIEGKSTDEDRKYVSSRIAYRLHITSDVAMQRSILGDATRKDKLAYDENTPGANMDYAKLWVSMTKIDNAPASVFDSARDALQHLPDNSYAVRVNSDGSYDAVFVTQPIDKGGAVGSSWDSITNKLQSKARAAGIKAQEEGLSFAVAYPNGMLQKVKTTFDYQIAVENLPSMDRSAKFDVTTAPQSNSGSADSLGYVQYAPNGSNTTGTMDIDSGKVDGDTKAKDNGYKRPGYTFAGWNTKSDGSGTEYQPGKTLKYAKNGVTLYAQWSANPAKLSYDKNGGTGTAPSPSDGVTDQEVTVAGNTYTRTGYTFTKWNATADGKGMAYEPGSKYRLPAGDSTIYAQWAANHYTVRYDKNNGTGTMADQDFEYDKNQNLTGNAYTRPGYTFNGWNTKPDNTGTDYKDNQNVGNLTAENNGTITLYAQWTANKATLTYDANGGTGEPQPQDGVTDQTIKVSETTPTRAGYTFAGWKDPNGKNVDKGSSITLPAGGVKLTAQWTANKATLTYDANGGTGEPQPQDGVTDQTIKVSETTPTRAGYTFAGWKDPNGKDYKPGKDITLPAGGVELTAQWTASSAVITYDANADNTKGETQRTKGVTDQTVKISKNGYTRTGYTFTGWNTRQDGTGTMYQPGADYRFTPEGNITLYAQWSANPATITFDGNARNVTGTTKPLATHYDAEENLPANGYKRDGYTFTGWSTKPGDNTADYAEGAKYKVTGDATLYAQWKADPASLSYDANGGDAASVPAKQTGVTDQTVTIGKAPSRTGYTFAGWSTSADGTGITLKPGDVYRLHGDATLHAKWTANDITIRYDANSDNVTGIMQDQTTKADQPLKLAPSTYTRPGYRFTGWSTTSTGTNQDGTPAPRYDDGASITTSTDVTLYAQWARTDGESIIRFDPNTTGRYTGRMPDLVVRNNEPTNLTKNLYKINGKYFTGWNTNTDGTGTTYEDGASITTSTDVTLYAQWSNTPTKPEIKPGDNDNNQNNNGNKPGDNGNNNSGDNNGNKPGNNNKPGDNGNTNPGENGNNNPGDNNQNNNGNKPGNNGNNNQNGNGNNSGTSDGNNNGTNGNGNKPGDNNSGDNNQNGNEPGNDNGGSNQTDNGNNPGSGDGNNGNGGGNKPETNTNGNGTIGDADKTNGTDKANTNKGNSLARTGSAIAGVLTTAMLALAAGVTALTAKLRRRDTK